MEEALRLRVNDSPGNGVRAVRAGGGAGGGEGRLTEDAEAGCYTNIYIGLLAI